MAKTADVIVVGAGVMGASIAFNLAKRGVTNVAVLEKNFVAAGATGKSSACVRQHYSTEVGARMVLRSLEIFQNFSAIVGAPAGFVRTGYLMGVGERDHKALKKVIAMQRAVGIKPHCCRRRKSRKSSRECPLMILWRARGSRTQVTPTLRIRLTLSCGAPASLACVCIKTLKLPA